MTLKRTLIITAAYPYGSAESFLTDEFAALMEHGLNILIWPVQYRPGMIERDDFPAGAELIAIDGRSIRSLVSLLSGLMRHPRRWARVLGLLSRDRLHLVKNLLILPSVARIHDSLDWTPVDHIHAHWLSTSGTAALALSVLTDIPFSVSAHRWDIVDANLVREKCSRAAFVRVISQASRRLLEERAGMGNLRVIHMGVTLGDPPMHADRGMESVLRLVTAANLVEVKGHEVILDAAELLQGRGFRFTWDIAGDGPLRTRLEEQISLRGLNDHVRILGHRSRRELLESYGDGCYDAFVLASLDLGEGLHEGIPVSLMEAMTYGISVIATTTGGVSELVRPGVDGLLVPPGDAESLVAAVMSLSNVELRMKLGQCGRERVKSDFAVMTCSKALVQTMNQVPR